MSQETKVIKAEIHIPEARVIKVEVNEAPQGWSGEKSVVTVNECVRILNQSHEKNKKHHEKIIRELHWARSKLAKAGRRTDLRRPNEMTWTDYIEKLDMSETTVWRMLKITDPSTGAFNAEKAAELRAKNRKTQNGKFFKILEELNIAEVDCPKCHVHMACPKCHKEIIDRKTLAALIHSEVEKELEASLEKLKKSNGKSQKTSNGKSQKTNGKVVEENKEKSITKYFFTVINPVDIPGDPENEYTERLSELGFTEGPDKGYNLDFSTTDFEEAENVASDAKDVLNSWHEGEGESIEILTN